MEEGRDGGLKESQSEGPCQGMASSCPPPRPSTLLSTHTPVINDV